MYCSKCGTPLADDTIFCSACGQATGITPRVGAPATAGYANPASVAVGGVARYAPTGATIVVPSPYAGFWLRLLAYIIDHVVLGVVFGVFVLVAIAATGLEYFRTTFHELQNNNGEFPVELISAVLLVVLAAMAMSWIYHAWMESSEYQGTLGKMALGLIVTDMNDQRVSFGRASGRFFARIISNLIPLELGYIMAGFTEKKQALHDMIAGCLVLKRI
jgi:uncharacterized RDD family membrane protein YckC